MSRQDFCWDVKIFIKIDSTKVGKRVLVKVKQNTALLRIYYSSCSLIYFARFKVMLAMTRVESNIKGYEREGKGKEK